MSIRPVTNSERKPNYGSIYSEAIGLKPGLGLLSQSIASVPVSADVGVVMLDDDSPDSFFQIEAYYGPVYLDTSGGNFDTGKRGRAQKYIRFKILKLNSRTQRKKMAQKIGTRLLTDTSTGFNKRFNNNWMMRDRYVCGSPQESSYTVAFMDDDDATTGSKIGLMPFARSIADGKLPGQQFTFDNDGHSYVYEYNQYVPKPGQVEMTMTIRRATSPSTK